jgi:hypothetical protein
VLKVAPGKAAVPDWFDSYSASLRALPPAAAAVGACAHAPPPGEPALVITGALPLNIDSACTGRDVHADVLRRNHALANHSDVAARAGRRTLFVA